MNLMNCHEPCDRMVLSKRWWSFYREKIGLNQGFNPLDLGTWDVKAAKPDFWWVPGPELLDPSTFIAIHLHCPSQTSYSYNMLYDLHIYILIYDILILYGYTCISTSIPILMHHLIISAHFPQPFRRSWQSASGRSLCLPGWPSCRGVQRSRKTCHL